MDRYVSSMEPMAPEMPPKNEATDQSFATLAGGIIDDAQSLIAQQFALLRTEVKQEIRQARNAAISLGIGGFLLAVAFVLLMMMLAYLLAATTTMPLWGSFGLVGAFVATAGGCLLYFGGKEAADVKLLPPQQTAQTLKENISWLKGKTSTTP